MRARVIGWATTLLLGCLAVGAAVGLASLGIVGSGVETVALASGLGGLAIGLSATRRSLRAERHDARFTDEMEALSRRLVRLEDQVFAQTYGRQPDGAGGPDLREMSSDMEALSAGFRSLAEAVSAQDRELSDIRDAARSPRPAAVAVPVAAPSRPEPAAEAPPRAMPSQLGPMPGLGERGPAFLAALDALAVPSFLPQPPVGTLEAAPAPLALPAPEDARSTDRDAAIRAAMAARRLDPHVAAIVTLPQRRALVHEMLGLLTLADETVLMPDEYRDAIVRLDLVAELDAQLMGHAVEAAGALAASGREGVIATPLSRRTLVDPVALERAVQAIGDGPAAERIIVTLDGADRSLPAAIREVLARLGRRGVGFALTGLDAPPMDGAALAASGIRYVKVPAPRLFDPALPDETASATEAACKALAEHGIRLVASDVGDDAIVPELIDCGVPLAQGYAVAIPVPVSTLAGHAAAAALPEAPAAEARRPLRSVLRRIG